MVFEIGKFYRHTTGLELAIVGEVETTLYGKCLVAESNEPSGNLVAVGRDESATQNFIEITKEEWMKNFTED